jgi:hypothetical protein
MTEDPSAEVERLYQELSARPDDNELRTRLAWAIRRMTEASLAVTSGQVRLIASDRQRQLARQAVAQIVELAPWDGELSAFTTGLAAEIDHGDRWVWQNLPAALTLAASVGLTGVGLVVTGGLTGDVVLLVVAAVISSAALAGIVLGFRKQSWQVTARSVQPVIEHPGI